MEMYKYTRLKAKVDAGELDAAYYVNFFGDDKCYIYSIENISRGIARGTITE